MWYARSAAFGRSHATSTFIDNCEAVKNPYLKKNDGAGCLYPLFSESSRVSNTGGLLSERSPSDVCGLTCFRAAVARPHKQVYHQPLKEARRAAHNLFYLLANKPATDGYAGVLHHFPRRTLLSCHRHVRLYHGVLGLALGLDSKDAPYCSRNLTLIISGFCSNACRPW